MLAHAHGRAATSQVSWRPFRRAKSAEIRMAYYRQLNDDIVCIDTGQHRPQMAACYLVGGDGHYAFVESGTSLSVPGLVDTLEELGVDRGAVDYVMPTHVHLDHAGGAGALLRKMPNARLVIHPRGARHMIDPSQLIAGATAVYGAEAMRATYGEIVPVPESHVIVADVAPDRDFELMLGNRRLQFIDRKSTRLNSSHPSISYAVFCLKKKN